MDKTITFEAELKRKKRNLSGFLYQLQNSRKASIEFTEKNYGCWTYPHAIEIFNILNPLYIAEMSDFSKIVEHEYILVRDGFCSLLNFFYRFSRPGGSRTLLLIHEKLAFIVPEIWKDNIITYNIQRNFECTHKRNLLSSLYLCVLSFDHKVDPQSLQREVSRIKKYYGDDFNQVKIKVGAFLNGSPYWVHWNASSKDLAHFVRELCIELGSDENMFYTWEEIVKERDFHNSSYHYITDEYFTHAYSYIDHFFLSKQCFPLANRFRPTQKGKFALDTLCGYEVHLNKFNYSSNGLWDDLLFTANKIGLGDSLCKPEVLPFLQKLWAKYSSLQVMTNGLNLSQSQVLQEKSACLQ